MPREIGEGGNVEAEIASRDQSRALVTVRVPARISTTFVASLNIFWSEPLT
jgi:hypothetical protein